MLHLRLGEDWTLEPWEFHGNSAEVKGEAVLVSSFPRQYVHLRKSQEDWWISSFAAPRQVPASAGGSKITSAIDTLSEIDGP